MSTAVQELSRHVLETKFEAFGKEDIQLAKNRIIDVVGCTLGGAYASGNSMIIDLVSEWGGREEATILGHGIKAPAHNVAMVNSVMARSYDYEVSGAFVEGKSFPGHQPSVTVPTALTVAEHKDVSGKELLTALILGDDILCRITAAADYSFDSPFDNAGTINKFGATAIASRLLGLNENQVVHAFGIVADTVATTFQALWDGVHSFKLHGALACRDGIFSAELASKGFTGLRDPLLSKFGFLPVYCRTYLTQFPDILTRDLGKKFYSGAGIGHKPYPCCHAIHACVECALQIIEKHNNIDHEDIDEVIVSVSRQRFDFCNKPYDIDVVAYQPYATFSIPYNVANVLLRKSVTKLEHFTEESVRDSKVIELAKKVKLVPVTLPEESIVGDMLEREYATDMVVKMRDGKELSAHVDTSKGRKGKELTNEEIKDKFRTNVAFSKIIPKEKSEEALNMLENLEEIDKVTRIIELLVQN